MFFNSESSEILKDNDRKEYRSLILLSYACVGPLSDYSLLSYEDAFFNYYYGFKTFHVSCYKGIVSRSLRNK